MTFNLKVPAAVLAIAVPAICGFEGAYTYAYRDPVGIPTICFGHIEGVRMGDRKTPQECADLLQEDLPRYYAGVHRCIHVPMSVKREAAMLSFVYNVGEGALCKSTVARKLNAGDVQGGCEALLRFTYARGIQLPGLVKRREAERKMCVQEDPIVVAVPMPRPKPDAIDPKTPQTYTEFREAHEPIEPTPKRLTWIEQAWRWLKGLFQ